jgi:hypothetical protein
MKEILDVAQGQPFTVIMLLVAIWWMNRTNTDLIGRLHTERNERLDRLEIAIAACEADRKALWEKLYQHTQEEK